MKKQLLRVIPLLLALVLVLLSVSSCSSCANTGEPMLTLEIDGKSYSYSVNLYELQLSILKGDLALAGYTVNGHNALQPAFWSVTDDFGDGKLQTIDNYYRGVILDECRYVLVAQYLFDLYGLSLSQATLDDLDDYLNEFVLTDGDGNKNQLNKVLADYGVNYDMLKEYLMMNARLEAVQNYLYGNLGHNVKQQYQEETYEHFNQIFLPNYDYVFETDENGDEIYYNTSDHSICYKETNYFDIVNGKVVYYTNATKTHISYDTQNGTRSYKMKDGNTYETVKKSDAELDALLAKANQLTASLQGKSAEAFDTVVAKESPEEMIYADGYYLQRGIEYSEASSTLFYLDKIMEKLKDAKEGDVFMVESSKGYHIVMKQKHTDKAYELSENNAWFEASYAVSFTQALTNRVFKSACEPYYESVSLDDALYATTKSLKDVLANYNYK